MPTLPAGARMISNASPKVRPRVWSDYSSLGAATSGAGPLTGRCGRAELET